MLTRQIEIVVADPSSLGASFRSIMHPCRLAGIFRRPICWWAFTLLLVASVQAQTTAPRHAVLIDGSGSMRGFFEQRKIQELHALLRTICEDSAESYYFVNDRLVPWDEKPLEIYGNETFLDKALSNALAQRPAPAIIWLITDNQPSSGGQTKSDADIKDFYKQLQDDKVKRLFLFPLRLPFSGALFKQDGFTKLTDKYVGQRGLLVYALLLDERAHDEFEKKTEEFQNRFVQVQAGGSPRLRIKPLEEDTVTAEVNEVVKTKQPGEFRFDHGSLVAGDFDPGVPIEATFKINLKSKLGQITINHAKVDAQVIGKFQTGDFAESTITPTCNPSMIENFQPTSVQPIDVKIKVPGVHIRNNLLSWWNCILKNRGDITGRIQVTISVPGQKFDVTSTVADEFSTNNDIYNVADEGTQSRIYKLNTLVKQMMSSERAVDIRPRIGDSKDGVIPVRLTVRYPKLPGLLLLGGIILLVLLALIAWRFFGRRQYYRLTWDNGNSRACPDFRLWPFVGQRVELDNRTVATISQGVSGIRVRAASGYTVDDTKTRPLYPGGSEFSVSQPADGYGITFHFSSVTAAFSGGSTARNNADDIFGGVGYGDSGEPGSGSMAPATLPVRKPTSGRSAAASSGSPSASDGKADEGPIDLDDLFP